MADDGFDVALTCRVLGVSRSSYYDLLARRPQRDRSRTPRLVEMITRVHYESRCTYGAPRVHAELRLGLGLAVGRKRVG